MPFRRGVSYLLFWHIAETVPKDIEDGLNETMHSRASAENPTPYISAPAYPVDLTLSQRMKQDVFKNEDGESRCYEPPRHEGTGVDSDEAQYESYLLEIDEALERLRGTSMEYVVRLGWDCIQARLEAEAQDASSTPKS